MHSINGRWCKEIAQLKIISLVHIYLLILPIFLIDFFSSLVSIAQDIAQWFAHLSSFFFGELFDLALKILAQFKCIWVCVVERGKEGDAIWRTVSAVAAADVDDKDYI